MNDRWLPMAMMMSLLPGGCAAETAPPPTPQSPAERLTDDFGLPLVIVIDVPETPKELQEPSPPIVEKPRGPAKR